MSSKDAKKASDDPEAMKIAQKVRPMLLATFLMTACNTMQSILYVPAALEVMGNAGGASRLMASLQTGSSLLDIIAAPTFGSIGDAFGRRMSLLGFAVTMAFSRMLMLGKQTKLTLSLSRIFAAFSAGLFSSTMQAALLDVTKDRPDLGGMWRATDASIKGMAVIFGPYLAGALGKKDYFQSRWLRKEKLPYIASTVVALAAFGSTFAFVKETNKEEDRKPFKPKVKNLAGFVNLFGKSPDMDKFAIMYTWFDVGQQTGPVFAIASKTLFGYDTETVARWLFAYGVGMAIAPGIIAKYTIPSLGSRGALNLDMFWATVANFLMATSQFAGPKFYWGALPFFTLALAGPSTNRTLAGRMGAKYCPDMGRGEFTGALSSMTSISKMLSPQLHANAFAYLTSPNAPLYYPGIPFFLCCLACSSYGLYLQSIPSEAFPWKKEEDAEKAAAKKKKLEQQQQKKA